MQPVATRSEHREATLRRLSDAAIALFERDGSTATIDAIAARAGVSRRTVFRYVEAKEELAYIHPLLWFDVFDAGLALAPSAPLAERLKAGSRAIAAHIDDDPEPPRRAFAVVSAHPELARGFNRISQRWIDRVAEEVRSDADPADPAARFRSRIIGAAVMGMVDAVTREWVAAPPSVTFTELYDTGFAVLTPLLPSK